MKTKTEIHLFQLYVQIKINELDNKQNRKISLIFHLTFRHLRKKTLRTPDAVNVLSDKVYLSLKYTVMNKVSQIGHQYCDRLT